MLSCEGEKMAARKNRRSPAKNPKNAKKAKVNALVTAGHAASKAGLQRAEDLLELIARRMNRIREDFYDIGVALRELIDKKLYRPLGFVSFEDMLAKREIMGKSQAYKLIAIARELPREEALTVGQERAYALTALAAATPEVDDARTILAAGVKVHGKTKNVSKLSKREIENVTKEVRAPRKANPAAKAAAGLARRAQQELRARRIEATVQADRRDQRWWATVRVPLDDLGALVRER